MSRNSIQSAVLQTASYFCEKYPQTEGKKINYSLGGSMSVVLLSMADTCRKCDVSMFRNVKRGEYIEITDEVKNILQKYARAVKDIDIEKRFNRSFVRDMKDIDINSMPLPAREGLSDQNKNIHICNKLGEFFKPELWRITIDGKKFYIQSLENMYKNKFMYIPANYANKYMDFNRDLELLGQAVTVHYGSQKMELVNDEMARQFKKIDDDFYFKKTFIVDKIDKKIGEMEFDGSGYVIKEFDRTENNYLRVRLNEVLRNPNLTPSLQSTIIDVVSRAGLREQVGISELKAMRNMQILINNIASRHAPEFEYEGSKLVM